METFCSTFALGAEKNRGTKVNNLTCSEYNMRVKNILSTLLLLTSIQFFALSQVNAPLPYGPIPNEHQMRWQQMEYYAFVHLSVMGSGMRSLILLPSDFLLFAKMYR